MVYVARYITLGPTGRGGQVASADVTVTSAGAQPPRSVGRRPHPLSRAQMSSRPVVGFDPRQGRRPFWRGSVNESSVPYILDGSEFSLTEGPGTDGAVDSCQPAIPTRKEPRPVIHRQQALLILKQRGSDRRGAPTRPNSTHPPRPNSERRTDRQLWYM